MIGPCDWKFAYIQIIRDQTNNINSPICLIDFVTIGRFQAITKMLIGVIDNDFSFFRHSSMLIRFVTLRNLFFSQVRIIK